MRNTTTYCLNKAAVAQCVEDDLMNLKPGWQLTTIIQPEQSGDYFVRTVIEELSEDTEKTSTLTS